MAIQNLGLSRDFLSKTSGPDRLIVGLSQIGASEARQKDVNTGKKKLSWFKRLGEDWESRISVLTDVVANRKIDVFDKLVAYGALFYLLCPFDLIPDSIPVIGLVDDFGIISLAAAYYIRKAKRAGVKSGS